MDLRTAKRTEGKEVGSVILFFRRIRILFFFPVRVRIIEFFGVGQELEFLYGELTQYSLSSFWMGELQLMDPRSECDLLSVDLEAV